ncbi:unnamed protein product [Amoebophrya sp. A25]|nr:unnamed protein product [Amoebophrya sp. A25]|eukprot:GSA25T00006335001.1
MKANRRFSFFYLLNNIENIFLFSKNIQKCTVIICTGKLMRIYKKCDHGATKRLH